MKKFLSVFLVLSLFFGLTVSSSAFDYSISVLPSSNLYCYCFSTDSVSSTNTKNDIMQFIASCTGFDFSYFLVNNGYTRHMRPVEINTDTNIVESFSDFRTICPVFYRATYDVSLMVNTNYTLKLACADQNALSSIRDFFPSSASVSISGASFSNLNYQIHDDTLIITFDTNYTPDIVKYDSQIDITFYFDDVYDSNRVLFYTSSLNLYYSNQYSTNSYLRNIQLFVDELEYKTQQSIDWLTTINSTIRSSTFDYLNPQLISLNDKIQTITQPILDIDTYLNNINTNVGYLKDLLYKTGAQSADLYNAITGTNSKLKGILDSLNNGNSSVLDAILVSNQISEQISSKLGYLKDLLHQTGAQSGDLYNAIMGSNNKLTNINDNFTHLMSGLQGDINSQFNKLLNGFYGLNSVPLYIFGDDFIQFSAPSDYSGFIDYILPYNHKSGQYTLSFDYTMLDMNTDPYGFYIGVCVFNADGETIFSSTRIMEDIKPHSGSVRLPIYSNSPITEVHFFAPYRGNMGKFNAPLFNMPEILTSANAFYYNCSYYNFVLYEGSGVDEYLKGVNYALSDITNILTAIKNDSVVQIQNFINENNIVSNVTNYSNDILLNFDVIFTFTDLIHQFLPDIDIETYDINEMFEILNFGGSE